MKKVYYFEEFKNKRRWKGFKKFLSRKKWSLISLFILFPINVAMGLLVSIEAAVVYAMFVYLLPLFLIKEIKKTRHGYPEPIPFKGRKY